MQILCVAADYLVMDYDLVKRYEVERVAQAEKILAGQVVPELPPDFDAYYRTDTANWSQLKLFPSQQDGELERASVEGPF